MHCVWNVSIILDSGIELLPWLRESVRTFQAPWGWRHLNAKTRQVVSSFLWNTTAKSQSPLSSWPWTGWDGSFIHAQELLDTMAWLHSAFGIFISLCLLALLWVSSAQTLWVAFGFGQILLLRDLFCSFLMPCESSVTTGTEEEHVVRTMENRFVPAK